MAEKLNRTKPRDLGLALFLSLAATALSAQTPDPVPDPQDPAGFALPRVRQGAIRMDGDLREWPKRGLDRAVLKLDQQTQVWAADPVRRGHWQGAADLSADLRLVYDANHLFIGGVVRDDQHLPARQGELPGVGDCLRIFIDRQGLDEREEREPGSKVALADLRVILVPREGRWSVQVIDPDLPEQLAASPGGANLSGVAVRARPLAGGGGYSFEAKIGFHNLLPGEDVGRDEVEGMRVQLSVHDRDAEQPGLFLSEGGAAPRALGSEPDTTQAASLRRLSFVGAGPLVDDPDQGGLHIAWEEALPWVVLVLVLVLAIGILSRRMPLTQLPPRKARMLRIAGVLLLLCGLLLPGWLIDSYRSPADLQRQHAVGLLEPGLKKMETLKSYVGASRDKPLMDLLQGGAIKQRRFLSHSFLSEIHPEAFQGWKPVHYPPFKLWKVRPYWIPLPEGQPQTFSFKKALEGKGLRVIISRPLRSDSFDFEDPLPTLRLAMRLRGEDDFEPAEALELRNGMVPAAEFGKFNREMTYVTPSLPGPVDAVRITSLGGQQIELVGLTLVPDTVEASESEEPLLLGQALGGVETDLRGVYPEREEAGIALPRQKRHRVVIPAGRRRPAHTCWMIYKASYPGFLTLPELLEGDEVCRVTLQFTKGDDQVVKLLHQQSMFYEYSARNKREDAAEGVPASLVAVSAEDAAEKRINVIYRLDFPKPEGRTIKAISFENLGPYPIVFRSVVFGFEGSLAPSEPSDSPLKRDAAGMVLQADYLQALAGVNCAIYRGGVLVESNLRPTLAERFRQVPKKVQERLLRSPNNRQDDTRDSSDGARTYMSYLPLPEESGAGAVLGLWVTDEDYGAYRRFLEILGLVLCLLAAPVLLLLINDALAYLQNLRLRLMAVASLAALVPLAVLFILLVKALEGGHEIEQQRVMRQAARTLFDQLKDRQGRLLQAANNWVTDLDKIASEFRKANAKAKPEARERLRAQLREQLRATMQNQLPPDWQQSFMRLEYQPEAGAPVWLEPFTEFAGDRDQADLDTPMRDEPGVYLVWGQGLIGVRTAQGNLSLSVGRLLGSDFLADLAPDPEQPAVLCDIHGGYEIISSAPGTLPPRLASWARARTGVQAEVREAQRPVVLRHAAMGDEWVAAYDVLRNIQGAPVALLGTMRRDRGATLPLAPLGSLPVRDFFVVLAGLLLVLSLALASVVTTRITDPIERLEKGAEALRRGQFDVQVESLEGGQIGRLTETFNNMADDLRGRILDLNQLNRGIQDLTSQLDLEQVLHSAVSFFTDHSPADRVRVLLLDPEQDRVEVFGAEQAEVDRQAPDVGALLSAEGAMGIRLRDDASDWELPRLFQGQRSLLAWPLILAGRNRGSVLLLFESSHPPEVNLELLSTFTAQTTVALENARLYRHAVEDLYTGAYVPDYFSRLCGSAVAQAQDQEQSLSLVGVQLPRGTRLEQSLGEVGYGRYMERVARCIRQTLHGDAMICRADVDAFQVLLPGQDREAAAASLARLERALLGAELDLRGAGDLRMARVTFPEEGASAEFLFHTLDGKLRGGPERRAQERVGRSSDGMVASSAPMVEVMRVLDRVAPSELTILLMGETGTGKEVLTDQIHRRSRRAKGPLIKVHCAALPESLLQSELFGYEKGAFTGAEARKPGKFEQAEGGTIFLDEIGEVSLDTQVKLLRVLQEREVDRIGGREPVPVDVRVVAATNRDIEAMVAEGSFREDLYYRLQGMVVTVPPLRERKAEIPELCELFRKEACAAGHTAVRGFSTDAMDELFRRAWPGNIRELRNSVFRALVLAGEGQLERSHLLGILSEDKLGEAGDVQLVAPAAGSAPVPGEAQGEVEDPAEPAAAAGSETDAREEVRELPRPPAARPPDSPAVVPRPDPELRGRLKDALLLLRSRGSLSNSEYCESVGVSARTGLRDLSELVDRGLVERRGRRRGARYYPIESATLAE